jgi:NOL1/NOP2/fmu family ribosome biogenesis protein
MMQKLNILNTREVKKIKEKLKEQFGFTDKLDYAFLLNEKGRLFIINRNVSKIDLKKLKVDKYGMYFGELGDELRLSMEGAWIVGNGAKKNIVELTKEEIKEYFLGVSIEKDLGSENKWVLLKYDGDIISCAKYKDKKILNFLPKIHRSSDVIV